MSYEQLVPAIFHGGEDTPDDLGSMTPEEFESTLEGWGESAPALAAHVRGFLDLAEDAWGVISNATDWDSKSRLEWTIAAEKWRDRWLASRPSSPSEAAKASETDPAEKA